MKFEVENRDDLLKVILAYVVFDKKYGHHTAPTGAIKLVKDLVCEHYQLNPLLLRWHQAKAFFTKCFSFVRLKFKPNAPPSEPHA